MAAVMKTTVVLINFLLFHSTFCEPNFGQYPWIPLPHSAVLDANDHFHLSWDFDENDIVFEVQVQTLGYFGLGFSPNGGMMDADIVIGGFASGSPYLQDHYATDHVEPELDERQDWYLSSGSQNDTHTTVRFWRKLNTCDEKDREIKAETIRVIWAYNKDDWHHTENKYHGSQRGSKSLFLLNPQKVVPAVPDDSFTIDFMHSNFNVPSDSTTYWCEAFTIDPILRKHHVIKVEPVVQPGNEGIVHHFIFAACHESITNRTAGHAQSCFDSSVPLEWRDCDVTVFAWAVGGGPFYFPEHVGYPFGLKDDPRLLILQTHYDNPTRSSDFMDSSGVRLTFTPTLRKYDAGLLSTGLLPTPTMVIPPFSKAFQIDGHCPAECLEQGMGNETEINIFAAFLHSHLLGRAIKLRHIRNGVEQRPISVDENYDFNFQETRVVKPEIKVQRGDNMVLECTYSSAHKNVVTFGGESTNHEMCMSFVLYYPRIPLTTCFSQLQRQEWAQLANVEIYPSNYTISEPEKQRGKNLFVVLANETDWSNPDVRARAQRITTSYESLSRLSCRRHSSISFDAHNKLFIPDRIDKEFVEIETCVVNGATSTVANRSVIAGIVLLVLRVWFN